MCYMATTSNQQWGCATNSSCKDNILQVIYNITKNQKSQNKSAKIEHFSSFAVHVASHNNNASL